MVDKKEDTEKKILDAAEIVFYKKGMDGARMQEIADEAGINKSLLHYYYRSKDKLFEMIFKKAISSFVPKMSAIWESDMPLFEKIEMFVAKYTDIFKKKPFIPSFVLHELNRHPARLVNTMRDAIGENRYKFFGALEHQIDEEVKKGTIKPIKIEHLIINLIGLCIFPYVAKPIMKGLFFEDNTKLYNQFLEERKEHVAEFIIRALKK
ncbi:MAG: TetR/AcrR family transcriptional regulator [Bacteroidales bacterium]|nr:TetR/AcrR family transcriptional regulator [Bacteroidales bacterium]